MTVATGPSGVQLWRLEGTRGAIVEEKALSRLTTDVQKNDARGTDFGCKHVVKTERTIGKHLARLFKLLLIFYICL
jgi:hypothetical protein